MSMTLSEAKKAHQKLEQDVATKIAEFNQKTGLRVTGVDYRNHRALNVIGGIIAECPQVKVTVEL